MRNTLLDRTGLLASTWSLAMTFVCFLLSHTYNGSIRPVPITFATGSTPNISPLLPSQGLVGLNQVQNILLGGSSIRFNISLEYELYYSTIFSCSLGSSTRPVPLVVGLTMGSPVGLPTHQ
jgi:hypothetical protein